MPYISAAPPETAPEAGKMWVDEGVSPSVWRSWRGADVPTAREFAEAFAAEAGAAAFDNALGQYTALSGAARYTIRQTGAGEPYPGGCGVNRIDPAGIVGRQAGTLVARDGDTVTVTSDGSAAYPCAQIAVALKANTTYTLTAQAAVLSGDASVRLRSRVSTDGGQSYPSQTMDASNIITEGTGTLRVTFTTTADTHRQICFFVADDAAAASVRFAQIQLEEGADQTAYAPYANVRAFRPRERAEVRACGKNLFDPGSLYASAANMDVSGDSVRIYTTGDGGAWRGARTPVFTIHAGVPYTLSATLDAYVSGNARIGLRGAENNTFLSGITLVFGSGTGSLSATYTPEADDEVYLSLLCTNSTVLTGDCTLSNIQLEIGGAATAYEPHRAMGGGAVTPDGPLYGLPEAMDSVDISVDGGVSLTRRTKLVTMDGANKSAVASTMPCASGAYALRHQRSRRARAWTTFAASCTPLCGRFQGRADSPKNGGQDDDRPDQQRRAQHLVFQRPADGRSVQRMACRTGCGGNAGADRPRPGRAGDGAGRGHRAARAAGGDGEPCDGRGRARARAARLGLGDHQRHLGCAPGGDLGDARCSPSLRMRSPCG